MTWPDLPQANTAAHHCILVGLEYAGHIQSPECPCKPTAAVILFDLADAPRTVWIHRELLGPGGGVSRETDPDAVTPTCIAARNIWRRQPACV
jgi:hypothetical protein